MLLWGKKKPIFGSTPTWKSFATPKMDKKEALHLPSFLVCVPLQDGAQASIQAGLRLAHGNTKLHPTEIPETLVKRTAPVGPPPAHDPVDQNAWQAAQRAVDQFHVGMGSFIVL